MYGRDVSSYVKEKLPAMISNELGSQNASGGGADVASVLRQSFIKCHRNLSKTQIDSEYSGTTCCTVLFIGNMLYTANSGDSRAILCSFSSSPDTQHNTTTKTGTRRPRVLIS